MIKKHRALVLLLLFAFAFAAVSMQAANNPAKASSAIPQSTIDKLLQAEKAGISNADLYNQLGLYYQRQGRTGKAVLCFLRALRLNSSHAAARNNLNYVINLTQDRELYSRPTFLPALFQQVFNFFSLNSLAVIVLILLLLTVLCGHWLLHLPNGQDKAVPVMWLVILGFVLLLGLSMLGLKYRGYLNTNKAVLMETSAESYSGPGPEYGKLFTIHEGLIVHINRQDKDWALITLPNGGAGWIPAAFLMRVRP
jgi:hypothetical protein